MTIWERFVDYIRSIFADGHTPQVSAYGLVRMAIVQTLKDLDREGVAIGGTAAVPRVEVHTVTEQARLDKGNAVRQLSVIVETIHNSSYEDAVVIADENLAALATWEPSSIGEINSDVQSYRILGCYPSQRQDLTESSDTNKIIYRILDTYDIWMEAVAVDPGPAPVPDPEPTPEPENP